MLKKILIFYFVCAITGFALGYSPPPDKLPALTPNAAAFILITGPPPGGEPELTCTLLIDASGCGSSGERGGALPKGQAINNASAIQICKITYWLASYYESTITTHIEIWSDINATGTKYGGNSNDIDVSNGSPCTEKVFTWDNTTGHEYPDPSGNYFIHLVTAFASPAELLWNSTLTTTCYATTAYDAFYGGVDQDRDAQFTLYTLQ